MDYETIKDMAKDNGIRVTDLLALAPANDPFYTGRPAEIDAANWFMSLWYRFSYNRGVHLQLRYYKSQRHNAKQLIFEVEMSVYLNSIQPIATGG